MRRAIDHARLLRPRAEHDDAETRVTMVELFFDLVFVFAVTQLSHTLQQSVSPRGGLETFILLMAMWWLWICTAWMSNWLDPVQTPIRLMLLAIMGGSLVLSSAIPQAFGDYGRTFAIAYVACQLGRAAISLWAVRGTNQVIIDNFRRILIWFVLAAPFWLLGGFVNGDARLALWLAGLVIDYLSAQVGYEVPGLGRSATTTWNVDPAHLAERCGLFVLIALGESIVVTGSTVAEDDHPATALILGFVASFVTSVTLWWIYFATSAVRANEQLASVTDPGRLARSAYTYVHPLIVAGIILVAVGDAFVLAGPSHPVDHPALVALLSGPTLFILGTGIFKWIALPGGYPASHVAGLLLLLLLWPATVLFDLELVHLTIATTIVLLVVAVWETVKPINLEEVAFIPDEVTGSG